MAKVKKGFHNETKDDTINMNVNFLVAGIEGFNPKIAAIGSVTFGMRFKWLFNMRLVRNLPTSDYE